VPSVLDVALAAKSSADAKACLAHLLATVAKLMHEDAANATAFIRTHTGESFGKVLLRLGSVYPDLLAALLPALGLLHQASGEISFRLVGSSPIYTAFSAASTPLGLPVAGDANVRSHGPDRVSSRITSAAGPSSSGRATQILSGRLRSRFSTARQSYVWPDRESAAPSGVPESDDTPTEAAPEDSKLKLVGFWTSLRSRGRPSQPAEGVRYGASTSTYTSCVVPFSGDLVTFLEDLEQLNGRRTNVGLYDNIHTVAIVHALWVHGAGLTHAALCASYLGLAALVAAFALLPAGAVPGWLLILCTLPFALAELGALVTSHSLAWYWASPYNWADWTNYVVLFVVGSPAVTDPDLRSLLVAFLVVLMSFKLLFYLRAYTTLVSTVLQAMKDMGAFALIVLLILVSFATARAVLDNSEAELGGDHGDIGESLGQSIPFLDTVSLMLGDYVLNDYRVGPDAGITRAGRQAIFYVFHCLVTIVLLNLLITILSDSHDLSVERRKAEYMRMRAQLIVEYHRLIPSILRPRGEWLHVLVSAGLLSEHHQEFELVDKAADDEWASRLSSVRSTLSAIRRESAELAERMDTKIDACNTRLDRLVGKMDSVLHSIQGVIAMNSAAREPEAQEAPINAARSTRKTRQNRNR